MIHRRTASLLLALAIGAGLASCGGHDDGNPTYPAPTIQVLSNRADLVSGGDALMEVSVPPGVDRNSLQVTVNGRDVTALFAARPALGNRIVGLVTGLSNGANAVVVRATSGASTLTVTNYPIGGPILLASQVTPWVCATPTAMPASGNTPASNASGLSTAAVDAQCNIATEYRLFYRTLTPVTATAGDGGCAFVLPDPSPSGTPTPANSCLQPYVVGTTPAASVASVTTTNGVTVPYIVRRERGTLNRGIYDIAVLFDPTKPWTAVDPQPQWNRKVIYSYGASSSIPRLQFRSEQNWAVAFINGFWDDTALKQGYMVVDNSITDALYNTNRILTAEATMMMKEHIVDTYGEIRYLMGNGGSGGAINQNLVASIHPGLLDGIQTSVVFPDSLTTASEVVDCTLLVNFYASPAWAALTTGLTQAQINAKKAAINGHRDQLGCHGWNNAFAGLLQPGNYVPRLVIDANGTIIPSPAGARNNCSLPAALVYDRTTNPTGVRCTEPDGAPSVWGTTTSLAGGSSTRALTVLDNTGVQYGLKALLSGAITPEDFVTINERVGGYDSDANLVATRAVADAVALPIAYRTGLVASGKNLAKVALIDSRGFDEGPTAINNIHFNWRSYELRARLDTDAGGHGTGVIWRYPALLLPTTAAQIAAVTTFSFTTMDAWLSNLATNAPKATVNAERTQAQVLAGKPSAAVDFCYLSTDPTYSTKITDQAVCDADAALKVYSSPRQVAGGALTENILKCTLKPLALSDYTGITFTAVQQARLNAVFAGGVCDWTKAGVGQQDAVSPLTFVGGPGGQPLGAPRWRVESRRRRRPLAFTKPIDRRHRPLVEWTSRIMCRFRFAEAAAVTIVAADARR